MNLPIKRWWSGFIGHFTYNLMYSKHENIGKLTYNVMFTYILMFTHLYSHVKKGTFIVRNLYFHVYLTKKPIKVGLKSAILRYTW